MNIVPTKQYVGSIGTNFIMNITIFQILQKRRFCKKLRRIFNLKIIGITGNSGAGKSLVASKIAKKINAECIDSDKLVGVMRRKRRRIL